AAGGRAGVEPARLRQQHDAPHRALRRLIDASVLHRGPGADQPVGPPARPSPKGAPMPAALSLAVLAVLTLLSSPLLAQGYDPTKPRGPAPSDAPAVPLNAEFDDLPDTPGVEETFYLCTACHSTAIIKQQRV